MVIIPLYKKIKKRIHKDIALAQDILVAEIYHYFPKAVLHGGTAIWRCLGSNRFSEDLDFYLPPFVPHKLNLFLKSLKDNGLLKIKFKQTSRAIFSRFSYQEAIISLEAVIKRVKDYETKPFEMIDGGTTIVNTLKSESLLKEKVASYLARQKIRDLYDIFFLLSFVEKNYQVRTLLNNFLSKYKAPKDEKDLKTLIIVGAVPKTNDMLKIIEKWAR